MMESKDYIYPAPLLGDFYKQSHRVQYPKGTELVYSTWESRVALPPLDFTNSAVAFGFQAFCKEYLIDYFNEYFFARPKDEVVAEYARFIKYTLGDQNPETQHIERLHDLGYVPLLIKAVKEGTQVPCRVPMLTVENTVPEFFWLTNFVETLLSCQTWVASTSATSAREFRKMMNEYCEKTGGASGFVQFQGHDFSMRGMASLDAALMSGGAHLLSFTGTDTAPCVLWLERYYNANIEKELVGTAIPATEHSVMQIQGKNEYEVYKHLMTETYPGGFLSIVSDTWDLWNVLDDVVPRLKDTIMARDGRVVIRPDSGDPTKIICGDPDGETETQRKGVVEKLWDTFGGFITDKGYKHLDPHIGCIYGESMSISAARQILDGLEAKGFASTNMVLGIGSVAYQFVSRDTLAFTFKCTYAVVNGEERLVYKAPSTDKSQIKYSPKGLVVVKKDEDGNLVCVDNLNREQWKSYNDVDLLEPIFEDGKLLRDQTLAEIREILWGPGVF
jgi:nicotinamide phosphoribosyltransferase